MLKNLNVLKILHMMPNDVWKIVRDYQTVFLSTFFALFVTIQSLKNACKVEETYEFLYIYNSCYERNKEVLLIVFLFNLFVLPTSYKSLVT